MLIERGKQAIAESRARDALRWGRKALAISSTDADGHALVADALFALRDFAGASEEYGLALMSRPDDRALKKALARARAGGRPVPAAPARSRRAAASTGAPASSTPAGDAPAEAAPPPDEAPAAPPPAAEPPPPAEPSDPAGT